jgi:hypothetical protein
MTDDLSKYDQFEKRLTDKYPAMFSQPYGGIAVGEGWWPIIESLCGNIQHYLNWINKNHEKHPVVEQVVVTQVKEKFGGLRFYYDGGDDRVIGMVRMAESWADKTCEDCGVPATKKTGGWIKNVCDKHFEEYEARRKERLGVK